MPPDAALSFCFNAHAFESVAATSTDYSWMHKNPFSTHSIIVLRLETLLGENAQEQLCKSPSMSVQGVVKSHLL